MKKLYEIFYDIKFEEVWKFFNMYYPDLKKLEEKYNNVFKSLAELKHSNNDNNTIIHIDAVEDFDWDETMLEDDTSNENEIIEYRVHAKEDNAEWDGYFDISHRLWDKWLGFYIEDSVLEKFEKAEVIALCLYEMTWLGFDHDRVKHRIENFAEED